MKARPKIGLKSITLSGFKSFAGGGDGQRIEFGDITVIIGANGAGKSNLISFFKMISFMRTKAFQQFVGEQGYASSLLHYGPKMTPIVSAKIEFENEDFYDAYSFTLAHAAQDSLIFTHEELSFHDKMNHPKAGNIVLPPGTKESGLNADMPNFNSNKTLRLIHGLLCNCRVYQFHDTSATAKIRNGGYINQSEVLYSDGGNLAAFLFGLKENGAFRKYYDKIVRHIKAVFPQFHDFSLVPNPRNQNYILLDWYEHNAQEYKFGSHQLSDGTIRFMALAALLLQPPQNLPAVILLDEPELGLHPTAILALAGMIKTASQHTQVVLATQNPALLDEFEPEQITVIDRDPRTKSSTFKKFSNDDLKLWLAEYSLSEIWDKNIMGGKP